MFTHCGWGKGQDTKSLAKTSSKSDSCVINQQEPVYHPPGCNWENPKSRIALHPSWNMITFYSYLNFNRFLSMFFIRPTLSFVFCLSMFFGGCNDMTVTAAAVRRRRRRRAEGLFYPDAGTAG
jgi:hypothetical protein